jgi:hypothetical protein|tara:strand:+ start:1157 stop:1585 length:429 start_codon:yes stop_codon:yes gene_type:complete
MKNFKSFLKESGINTSHQDQALDKNMNMSVYSDPAVVKKLNAWVGTIAGNYVLPEDAISNLRSSLSKIGLSFDEVPMMEGESGSVELPLTSFGGRFGKGLTTPYNEFEVDDGISHQVEGGLKLVVGYEMQEDNSCRLSASIQ